MSQSETPEHRQEPDFATHEVHSEESQEISYEPPTPSGRRLLRRSKQDRVIAGIGGGLGRYFDAEPVVFRVAFVVLLLTGGFGLLLYLIAWIAIPEFKTQQDEQRDTAAHYPLGHRSGGTILGGLLILIGTVILLNRFIDWLDPRVIGGSVLIIIGAVIVIRGLQGEARK